MIRESRSDRQSYNQKNLDAPFEIKYLGYDTCEIKAARQSIIAPLCGMHAELND